MKYMINLASGTWRMREFRSKVWHAAHIPGSVYADLMADGTMSDPFYRDNEFAAFELMKKDWEYVCTFSVAEETLTREHIELVCEGLDTLAELSLNGMPVGKADNMHITWVWDVKPHLCAGENELRIIFSSPIKYCERYSSSVDRLASTRQHQADADPNPSRTYSAPCEGAGTLE